MFAISREGRDDKGRTSYSIISDEYGPVQWSPTKREIFVEFLGDAPLDTTFSMVDRGAV
ncbi:hypothetical protein [Micromonospora sp. NPDC005324]|uniref:hypothetical protein n=1 Tax=Micromonospora sp. NPDC005324 TaxID=3157033 RepID=UPI0033AC3708